MTRLVLASGSAVRAAMLTNACVPHKIRVASVDEDAAKKQLLGENRDMRGIAEALAELKALSVSANDPGGLILGADQLLVFEGRALSKAKSMEEARDVLSQMRGKSHELLSAAVLAKDGALVWKHVGHARLRMRHFSDDFLDDYLASEGADLLKGVGCYRIEGKGVQLFESVEGDNFTIQGLPLLPLLGALREHGVIAP